jgi:hypothetical protein
MGLTLIEAAKYESRLEHLAVIKTFSEGELLSRLPFMNIAGGDVDVDRSIVDLQGPEARASQVEMKVRLMRLTLEATLINGDATASQARGFDGLAKRLTPGAEMAINNGATALDFDKLDELIDSVNSYGGGPPYRWTPTLMHHRCSTSISRQRSTMASHQCSLATTQP